MATGGFDAREDRIRRRDLKKLEEEKVPNGARSRIL